MKKGKPFPLLIVLPLVTPSNNRLLRMHYFARKKQKETCLKWLIAAGAKDLRFQALEEKRVVEIHSFRKRRLDPDNLIGGMKLLIDSLCDVGLIWDDSPKYLDLTVIQETERKNPRTEIKIIREEQ